MARDFDGVDDVIVTLNNAVYEFTASESYTLAAWVRHDALGEYHAYISNSSATNDQFIFRKNPTNNIQYEFGNAGVVQQTLTGTTALSLDTWYFVAVVRDVGADQVRLYLATANGDVTQEASVTDNTTTAHSGLAHRFGEQSGGFRMNGRMAEITQWNRALSVNELRAVKQGRYYQLTGKEGHWPLWGVASPEPDLSQNKGNGTVTGAVAAAHAPVGPYAPFDIDQFYSAVVTAVEDTISPTGIVSAEAVGTASSQLVVGATGVFSAEDWGEANYADERFTYADSALDYEGHAAVINVVLQVQPAGIASAEAFGTTEVISEGAATITPSGIASEEAFGTPALSFVVQPTGIVSEEAVGTASVGLVVVPSGIPSDEAVGTPVLIVQIQPNGIASEEAFGTPLVGTVIAVSGIPSEEAVGAPSVQVVVAPAAIPTGQAFGTPAVSGPSTISVQGIASAEAIGSLSLVTVIAPTGVVSGEAVGTPTVALVQLLVVGIPSEEAFGTAQLVGVIQPTGIASAEVLGTPTVVVLGPSQPAHILLRGIHSPTISLNGKHDPDDALIGGHDSATALVGNSGL